MTFYKVTQYCREPFCLSSWFPQIMTYPFQGLLMYIFKEFSRTFLCSFKHPFTKKLSTVDFSNKTYRDHFISSLPEKWWGGGDFLYVFSTFLDALLHYGYKTVSNNSAWKGGMGVLPQKFFLLELVQNPAILEGTLAWLLCHNKSRDYPFWNHTCEPPVGRINSPVFFRSSPDLQHPPENSPDFYMFTSQLCS